MKFDIRFEVNSLNDFNNGLSYYQIISDHLAELFYHEFWACVEKLIENPNAFQLRYLNARIAKIKRFPFTIHFFIENSTIYVQRVLHEKRNY